LATRGLVVVSVEVGPMTPGCLYVTLRYSLIADTPRAGTFPSWEPATQTFIRCLSGGFLHITSYGDKEQGEYLENCCSLHLCSNYDL